ncbi:MAG: META domain-containing protein [Anaerolineae bacterium]|jgi:heat shock protein HslJ
MKRTTFTIAVMALAVLLAACGAGPAGGVDLPDTRWVLVTLEGESPLPDRAPSAEFSEDQISGSTGCNTYFGTYEVSDDELSIGAVAVTEMWCMEPEGVMDQEEAFLAALASVTGYRLAGEQLELLDGTGETILSFEPRAAED